MEPRTRVVGFVEGGDSYRAAGMFRVSTRFVNHMARPRGRPAHSIRDRRTGAAMASSPRRRSGFAQMAGSPDAMVDEHTVAMRGERPVEVHRP